ncbi:type IIL restriction-modification enzyme MmeI [Aeoliella sp. SH292]|uniref:type IIL restriction-modification enzyme MmeI n=1 Tax=Aeoliella sp. SH292 TaxID=3454464 RepID=UPI003F961C16
MPTPRTDSDPAQSFITRWKSSGGAERANYQMFLTELCDLLAVQRPDPASDDNAQNAYVFERSVPLDNRDGTTTTGFIDLYRRQHFVCETKQGVERDDQQQPLSEAELERRKRSRTGHGTRGTKTFDDAMRKANAQAGNYARSLPPDEGRPPFLVVVDVGHKCLPCNNLRDFNIWRQQDPPALLQLLSAVGIGTGNRYPPRYSWLSTSM